MIFNYYSRQNTPRGQYVPKVWIMGQIMSVALDTIEEVDESEGSLETSSSPIVPARLTEMTTFPCLMDFCKQSGSSTLAYLLELMHEEEPQDAPPAQAGLGVGVLEGDDSFVEMPSRRPISGLAWGAPF